MQTTAYCPRHRFGYMRSLLYACRVAGIDEIRSSYFPVIANQEQISRGVPRRGGEKAILLQRTRVDVSQHRYAVSTSLACSYICCIFRRKWLFFRRYNFWAFPLPFAWVDEEYDQNGKMEASVSGWSNVVSKFVSEMATVSISTSSELDGSYPASIDYYCWYCINRAWFCVWVVTIRWKRKPVDVLNVEKTPTVTIHSIQNTSVICNSWHGLNRFVICYRSLVRVGHNHNYSEWSCINCRSLIPVTKLCNPCPQCLKPSAGTSKRHSGLTDSDSPRRPSFTSSSVLLKMSGSYAADRKGVATRQSWII